MRLRIDFEAAPVILPRELLSVVTGVERLAVLVSVLSGETDARAIASRWCLHQHLVADAVAYFERLGVLSVDQFEGLTDEC